MSQQNIHLVIIDPQNDFCDSPASARPVIDGVVQSPSLPVTGAHADMQRIASLISLAGAGISNISITMDSHQRLDIAHPPFWRQANGAEVEPFTQITADDVRAGRYRLSKEVSEGCSGTALTLLTERLHTARAIAYLEALESNGRYTHMVWPVHCEVGTWGHRIHNAVHRATLAWEDATNRLANTVIKGTNQWTEHYSAIKAEVPDPSDPSTEMNQAFISQLKSSDVVLITGEASSHCVKATTEHLVERIDARHAGKIVLLTDCMSPVTGFEDNHKAFIENMQSKGVQIARSEDVLPMLIANQ